MSNTINSNSDLGGQQAGTATKKMFNSDGSEHSNNVGQAAQPTKSAKRGLLKLASKLTPNRKRTPQSGMTSIGGPHIMALPGESGLAAGGEVILNDTTDAEEDSSELTGAALPPDEESSTELLTDDENISSDVAASFQCSEPIGANLVISSPVLSRHSSSPIPAPFPLVCTPVAPGSDSPSSSNSPVPVRRLSVQRGITRMVAVEQAVSTSRPEMLRSFSTGSGRSVDMDPDHNGDSHRVCQTSNDELQSESGMTNGDNIDLSNVEMRRVSRRRLKQRSISTTESPVVGLTSGLETTALPEQLSMSKTPGFSRSSSRGSSAGMSETLSSMVLLRAHADVCGVTDTLVRSSSLVDSMPMLELQNKVVNNDTTIVEQVNYAQEHIPDCHNECLVPEAVANASEPILDTVNLATVSNVAAEVANIGSDAILNNSEIAEVLALEPNFVSETLADETISVSGISSANDSVATLQSENPDEPANESVWERRTSTEPVVLTAVESATAEQSEEQVGDVTRQNRIVLRRGSGKCSYYKLLAC